MASDETIHFAFVGDNRHLPHLPALILSLEHYNPGSEYHILTAPAAKVDCIKDVLQDIVPLHFYVDPEPIVPKFFAHRRITEATFLKISLFKYLPVPKFICLEIDMICKGSLRPVWDALNTKPWAAVPSPWFSSLSENGVWGEAGEQHFVPGIFAVDKRAYPDFYDRAKDYILSHDLNAQHCEIDSICSIVGNDFFRLPQKYQFCTFFVVDNPNRNDRRLEFYLEQCKWDDIAIIHYGGVHKPWCGKPLYYQEWKKWEQIALNKQRKTEHLP